MPATPVYLDHQATTPCDSRVVEAMLPFFTDEFGNAASRTHAFGWRAEAAVEAARETVARALGAPARDVVFTSGATESNNLALKGALRARSDRGDHLVTVVTEHSSVLDPCVALEAEGVRVTRLPVDGDGLVDPDAVRDAIQERTVLVSVMAANNEIGVLQPIAAIGAVCRERGVWFHTDAAQAFGKVPLDVQAAQVDLLSISAHKLYGPKGIGALYVRGSRPRVRLEPLLHGGGHERGLRSGTLAVPGIVGLARATEIALAERDAEARRLASLCERLWTRLRDALGDMVRNGHPERRLPGNLNVSFPGLEADALIAELKGVAVSTGSACTSARPEPSHVLKALGLPDDLVRASLRFGLGRGNSAEEIDRVADQLVEAVQRLRARRTRVRGAKASA